MEPGVWLYTKDHRTIRIVQRPAETGTEVLIVAPEGVRTQQVFATPEDATRFRESIARRIAAKGFTLAWGSPEPT